MRSVVGNPTTVKSGCDGFTARSLMTGCAGAGSWTGTVIDVAAAIRAAAANKSIMMGLPVQCLM
jgi:hypothetical protein